MDVVFYFLYILGIYVYKNALRKKEYSAML